MYDYLESNDDSLLMRSSGLWAAIKLDYLRRLIDAFETSMRDKWPIRNYIDLMAGPGKNRIRRAGQVLLGSPLIALKAKHPFTGYYFVDSNLKNTRALEERCQASPYHNRIQIMTGDCNLLVDDIVKDLKRNENQSLNLAFLDPEGLELHWNTVAKLARIRKMDFLINYPENGLTRSMAKLYLSETETRVDLFFGNRKWREIYARCMHKRGLHRDLIDQYRRQLQELGYQEVKRSDEVGLQEPLIRNIQKNAPLYRLIFASKNPLGEKFWRDITKRDVYGQRRLLDSL